MREQPRVIDDARVAPLCFDDLLKFSRGLAARDGDLHSATGVIAVSGDTTKQQHFGPEGERHFHEVRRAVAAQRHDRLLDLERIPAGPA